MTLTTDQLNQLVENYAERLVDEMDTKCLERFVYDTIVENLYYKGENDVLEEIANVYDDEILQELIDSVKG